MEDLKEIIERTWEDRSLLKNDDTKEAIREVVNLLDQGKIRVAEPQNDGWLVNEWIKKGVILYFPIQPMKTTNYFGKDFILIDVTELA